MTLWSELFPDRNLLSRQYFNRDDGVVEDVPAPAAAGIIRVSASGGGCAGPSPGGNFSGSPGGGAAFARTKTTCTGGEVFTVRVGRAINGTPTQAIIAHQSIVARKTSGTIICRAAHGYMPGGGPVEDCIGDVIRPGQQAVSGIPGASAGDDQDLFPLGFGGPPAARPGGYGNRWGAAYYGGGGWAKWPFYFEPGGGPTVFASSPAGGGLVCVEFFRTDPGY